MALFSALLGSAVNQPHLERAGGVGQLRGARVWDGIVGNPSHLCEKIQKNLQNAGFLKNTYYFGIINPYSLN